MSRASTVCANMLEGIPLATGRMDYTPGYAAYVSVWPHALPLKALVIGQSPYDHNWFPHMASAFSFDDRKTLRNDKYCPNGIPVSVAFLTHDAQQVAGVPRELALAMIRDSWQHVRDGILFINASVLWKDSNESPRYFDEAVVQTRALCELIRISAEMGAKGISLYGIGTEGQRVCSMVKSAIPSSVVKVTQYHCPHPASMARKGVFGDCFPPSLTLGCSSFSRSFWQMICSTKAAMEHQMNSPAKSKTRYTDLVQREQDIAKEGESLRRAQERIQSFQTDALRLGTLMDKYGTTHSDAMDKMDKVGQLVMTVMDEETSSSLALLLKGFNQSALRAKETLDALVLTLRAMGVRTSSVLDIQRELEAAKLSATESPLINKVSPGTGMGSSLMGGMSPARQSTPLTRQPAGRLTLGKKNVDVQRTPSSPSPIVTTPIHTSSIIPRTVQSDSVLVDSPKGDEGISVSSDAEQGKEEEDSPVTPIASPSVLPSIEPIEAGVYDVSLEPAVQSADRLLLSMLKMAKNDTPSLTNVCDEVTSYIRRKGLPTSQAARYAVRMSRYYYVSSGEQWNPALQYDESSGTKQVTNYELFSTGREEVNSFISSIVERV